MIWRGVTRVSFNEARYLAYSGSIAPWAFTHSGGRSARSTVAGMLRVKNAFAGEAAAASANPAKPRVPSALRRLTGRSLENEAGSKSMEKKRGWVRPEKR